MSTDSLFAEEYGVTARNPFYTGSHIVCEYDFFPKGLSSLDTTYARLVDSSLALNQIMESPSFEEVDDFYNPGTEEVSPGYVLEAITVENFSRTEKRMAAVVRTFNKHLSSSPISALPPVVGKPKKSGSFAYVTVQIPFSDGQAVSIIFHAPEGDKKKITASDTIIAFRWLLNKRDITQVVAPEDGVEISLDTIALRVTQLVVKNSARFEKQQKGAAEERKALEDAKEALRSAEEKQSSLMDAIVKSKEDEQDIDARIRAMKTSIVRQQTENAELRAKLDALRAQRKHDEQSATGKTAPAVHNEETKAIRREDGDALTICADGYAHGDTTHNPYLLTSDNSDAFVFGVWAKLQGMVMPRTLKKSRGNSWKIDGSVYKIDGNDVTLVSGPGLSSQAGSLDNTLFKATPEYATLLSDIITGKYDAEDTAKIGTMLDHAADAVERDGAMEQYEPLLNSAADKLTQLLKKRAA